MRTAAPRDTCPLCGKTVAVNADGTLRKHTVPKADMQVLPDVCNGAGITAPSMRADPMAGRTWQPVESFAAPGATGARRYTVSVGDRCKVAGLGRGGAAGAGWQVIGIQRHTGTGEVNVAVLRDRDSRERIVKADRIIAQPRKGRTNTMTRPVGKAASR